MPHGVSIGSLGGVGSRTYIRLAWIQCINGQTLWCAGKNDMVQNIYVKDITMINSTKALGIKLYRGGSPTGTASVSNVTYDGVSVSGCDVSISSEPLVRYYSQINRTLCRSKAAIEARALLVV
jgi:hypothetical protein